MIGTLETFFQFHSKSGTSTEEVGHIMLDLRSISNEGSEYKWYPLSRNKYKTHKPQVRLMLSTEEPDGEPQQVSLSFLKT